MAKLNCAVVFQLFLLVLLASQIACAENNESISSLVQSAQSVNSKYVKQPFPSTLIKYKARLFELTEKDETKYDKEFYNNFKTLINFQTQIEPKFYQRITSGPATNGDYIVTPTSSFVHYGICQAHQCDVTNLDILFEPKTKKMYGYLLNKCEPRWLGEPTEIEKKVLNGIRITYRPVPSALNCEYSK